jgi:hypothetical protein
MNPTDGKASIFRVPLTRFSGGFSVHPLQAADSMILGTRTMRHRNPYIDWRPNLAALITRLQVQAAAGAGQVRRLLALVEGAGRDWASDGPHRHKMKPCEGTPFCASDLRLTGMLRDMPRRERKSRMMEAGVVYFLAAGAPDIVKIGFTRNLGGCIKSLRTGSPVDVQVLLLIKGTHGDRARAPQAFRR